ncbi:MAG: bacillithiol biosynthesis BshC, partial [Planctomycetes bacterium]|nr:bacillithiol biosynthesis BshC [Planctomycetota bacterium]
PDGRTRLDRAAALALATADPTMLSPGAPLRPVLQQQALPAAIFVAGPGERSYHEFIQPLYRTIGVPAPELVPRCSITLLPTRVRRILARWGVAAAEVTADSTGPVIQTAADPCDRPSAALDAAITAIAGAGAGRPEVEVTVRRLRRVAQAFQKRLQRSQRRAQDLPPFGTAVSWLWPRSQHQERVMSVFQALWEAGPGVADALVETAARTAPGDVTSLSI